jgi:uncharacterized LabA/DUF88 family protein
VADRAILFIDGNNWYHALRSAGLDDLGKLDYAKISEKLIGPREWVGTRYYIGQVKQQLNTRLYADQRRFLMGLRSTDARITVHLGRLEPRPAKNEAAEELATYLGGLTTRIEAGVYQDLLALAQRHRRSKVFVEKAVDVMVAVDMVLLAAQNRYDAAYVLSADGDLTPAVDAVRAVGKKVYVASAGYGAQLRAAANTFIRLPPSWFGDCLYDRSASTAPSSALPSAGATVRAP